MSATILNTTLSARAQWRALTNDQPELYDLWVKIFSNLQVSHLGRYAQVSKAWKIVAEDEGLWMPFVRGQVLGKKVWEDKVGPVGDDEPEYRMVPFYGMGKEKIPWKEVYKMHKNPSTYRLNGYMWMTKMPEFDFLVPATIRGKPTTLRNLIEIFKISEQGNGRSFIAPDILEKYGDLSIKKSYFARHTWTVVNGTRTSDIRTQVQQIHIQGNGLYRFHTLLETVIFQSLCYLSGIESGYMDREYGDSPKPQTYSRCGLTMRDNGVTKLICAGWAHKFVPEWKDQVSLYIATFDGIGPIPPGAGALREL